jgi:hypothetical protein
VSGTGPSRASRWRRPTVSTFPLVREAALAFCPPYEIEDQAGRATSVLLRDPEGRRPPLRLRHRGERRLFLRANYLRIEVEVPGNGPSRDGELAFRFRGPFRRQRAALAWREPLADGEAWIRRLEAPLLAGLAGVEAVQSLRIRWLPRSREWRLILETMSGSVMSGFMAPLPIPVAFERREAQGIIAMVDALAATSAEG